MDFTFMDHSYSVQSVSFPHVSFHTVSQKFEKKKRDSNFNGLN